MFPNSYYAATFTVTFTVFVDPSANVIVISFVIAPVVSGVNAVAFVVASFGKLVIAASNAAFVTSTSFVADTASKSASNSSASLFPPSPHPI